MALFGKLTKFQILDILAKFEEKLPNMGTKIFEPSENFNPHDILSINVEARRMVHFLGLTDYMPEIHFENLPKSVAANVSMENSTVLKRIDINVDYNTLYNNAHALRVLAHEVCHKYLQLYGLYTGFVELEDEARAELCTIYSGFGIVTLNGYKEEAGYVNIDDFCLAFSLVYKTRGMSDNDILASTPEQHRAKMAQALSLMEKISTMGEAVRLSQKDDARFRRNLFLLEYVIKDKTRINERHHGQDITLKRNQYKEENKDKYPLYDLMSRELMLNNTMNDETLCECNAQIEKLLRLLTKQLGTNVENMNKALTTEIVCPDCGRVNIQNIPAEVVVRRCKKCKHYFAWDATEWHPEDENKTYEAPKEEMKTETLSTWHKLLKKFGF